MIETAIAAPVLLLLVFGSIELANGVFLREALNTAAYEGARAASESGASGSQALARVDEVMAARGIAEYEVSLSPNVTPDTPRGTVLTVTITAPASAYSIGPARILVDQQVSRRFSMVRL